MSMKIDIVMQGPIWPQTYDIANYYKSHPLVENVVISTWTDQPFRDDLSELITIKSIPLENPGMGNRNRQLHSSYIGIKQCRAPIVVKTRTDQKLEHQSLQRMYDYFKGNNRIEEKFIDGSGPKGAIFVLGLFTRFPFHPQDHLFWGWSEDMEILFNAPLDSQVPNPNQVTDNSGTATDYTHTVTRPNTYIGMFYYAKFDDRIKYMVENYKEYIVDAAPKIVESLELDKIYRDKIFKAFPRISLWWYKHNRNYPYEWGIPNSEYQGE